MLGQDSERPRALLASAGAAAAAAAAAAEQLASSMHGVEGRTIRGLNSGAVRGHRVGI